MCLEREWAALFFFFFLNPESWQLSKCLRCYGKTSKSFEDKETTHWRRRVVRDLLSSKPFSPHLWRLTDSFLFQPPLVDPVLACRVCQYWVTYWPLGTVRPGCVLTLGTPLWTGTCSKCFFYVKWICNHWIYSMNGPQLVGVEIFLTVGNWWWKWFKVFFCFFFLWLIDDEWLSSTVCFTQLFWSGGALRKWMLPFRWWMSNKVNIQTSSVGSRIASKELVFIVLEFLKWHPVILVPVML